MAGTVRQIMTKRSIKPKSQYSPSNPTVTTMYHLIIYDDNDDTMIVGNSSVKRVGSDDTVMLNDGRTAKLIASGTKDKCLEQWNKQTRLSKDNNNDGQVQDDDDELSDIMEQTLQLPVNNFSTPAPYRRQKTLVRRSSSPDSIFSVSSPKRFVLEDHSSRPTKCFTNDLSSSKKANRVVKVVSPVASPSDDEEIMDTNDTMSLGRLFKELKNTQANIQDSRTENRGIHQQLTNLTKKMSHFSSLVISKNDHDLDRYRDSNVKEDFKSAIIHDGSDLLEVPARNAREYARNLLKILFKPDELQSSLLPSQQSKRYLKPELDHQRFNLLNEAIRTRYRIAKYHYNSFYRDTIQETLTACIYNEGTRKPKKQLVQQQQENGQQQRQQQEDSQQQQQEDSQQQQEDGDQQQRTL